MVGSIFTRLAIPGTEFIDLLPDPLSTRCGEARWKTNSKSTRILNPYGYY
jgi:hypothetical protein